MTKGYKCGKNQSSMTLINEMSVCGEYVYNIYVLNNVLRFYNPFNILIFLNVVRNNLQKKSDLQII